MQRAKEIRDSSCSAVAFAGVLFLIVTCQLAASAAERKVVLGLTHRDAEKQNVEFRKYERMIPFYEENGIQASLVEHWAFFHHTVPEDDIYRMLRRCHVVHLVMTDEGATKLTPEHVRRAETVRRALARYVREGGGLFLQPRAVRYPGDRDEDYWNMVMEPFGAKILHEGLFDKTRSYEGRTLGPAVFWYTENVRAHPVTQGVERLYLPLHDFGKNPGFAAMRYSPEWKMVVRGEREAKSYRSGEDNCVNVDVEGTYRDRPPVLAVREFGKGRIACYPLSPLFTGLNYGNPLWPSVVESAGDVDAGRPSHSMRLQMNCYRWLAGPATLNPELGTYRPEPYRPVEFPKTVDWDGERFQLPLAGVRGVFGAHSSYTDGRGTVAEYVRAAKKAGLSVIVFSDPLERHSPETLERLKADCAKASEDPGFYACPGIEFTDGVGNRWVLWGESVKFPEKTFVNNNRTYTQWDGRRVRHYGQFAQNSCQFAGTALLDYKKLRAAGAHPENLWWFFHYVPFAYERNRLIADNMDEYLFGLRDMRWSAVVSFTRIKRPTDVARAATTCFTGFRDVVSAKQALNTRCAAYWAAAGAGQYTSQGPAIELWQVVNTQMESHWKYTRGAQRVRVRFAVRSPDGIAEVKVHDADLGPIRRFLGKGAEEMAREFELVHDRQHYLVLEVVDTKGKRAVSTYLLVFCYKQGLFRCGDNLNILGATGLMWHPDRNEMPTLTKDFANASQFAVRGWDTSSASLGVPVPAAWLLDEICLEGTGWYPDRYKLEALSGKILDVGLSSHNLQIATVRMTKLSELYCTDERPEPAWASVARDRGNIEFFERTHTLYSPADRSDAYVAWNHRRVREALKDYEGALIWHEGHIRFRKDVVLDGHVPVPLVNMRCPADPERRTCDTVVVTDADGSTRVAMLVDKDRQIRLRGRIRPGGYASQMTTVAGYHGFLAPAGTDYAYEFSSPGETRIGLGRDGQEVKAGTVMRYRFAFGTFADREAGNALLEHTVRALNMGGGRDGYPVRMKAGEVADATFFFTARAKGNEACFRLGPQKLIIDLPIRVLGLEDNGCTAVWSERRPWFRFVPVAKDGIVYFQEPIERANDIWVGNVFVCDDKAVRITVVVDGQAEGARPFVEVHNPTGGGIAARLRSPAHAPVFGGTSATVRLPAGDSVRFRVVGHRDGKRLEAM